MPAKKKSASKKTVAKKNTPTKSTSAASKKAARKSAQKSTKEKESAATAKKTTAASEVIKRTRQAQRSTPSVRKHAPVVFTMEDAREALKRRKPEDEAAVATRKPRAPKAEASAAAAEAARKSKHAAASLADILGFGGGPAAPQQPAGSAPKPEIPKKYRKYYGLLQELRTHVQTSLGMHAEDTLKRSQKEDSGDISTSSDAGTDNFDRDFALSVVSSEQEALREIETAIQRIHKGTYGTCEITGEPIAAERLEAVPFTRFSLEGQRQYEATARRRVQRGGGGSFLAEGGDIAFASGDDDDGDN